MGLCIHGWPQLDPCICPWRPLKKRAYIYLNYKYFTVFRWWWHFMCACVQSTNYHGAQGITIYCRRCAEWNVDFIGAATAYELIDNKYFVLRMGIVVWVHVIRQRASAVASMLMCHVWLLLAHWPKNNYAIVLKTSSRVCFHFWFPVWPWEIHILGQYSAIGRDLQLQEYMSEIYFEYTYGQALDRCNRLFSQMPTKILIQRDSGV